VGLAVAAIEEWCHAIGDFTGSVAMRSRAVILAAAIVMAPLGGQGADLVVWWEEGYYEQEDEALSEIVAAFEQETGKQVELVLYPYAELPERMEAAFEAGDPPDSATWSDIDNNKAFLAQTIVMTPNESLSIVNALKHERAQDYYENTVTIEWPLGPRGNAFPIRGSFYAAPIFRDGGHVATAKEFVRFLVADGWLAHYLDFAGERLLPPMPKLLDAPFWLDPSDPHRMAAAMQVASRPMQYDYLTVTGDSRYDRIDVWRRAVHRVVTENITSEQAVDEAIARIKQILSE
jgi:ABC-type glycerol-3-phosphate transport system substrate-binding protein